MPVAGSSPHHRIARFQICKGQFLSSDCNQPTTAKFHRTSGRWLRSTHLHTCHMEHDTPGLQCLVSRAPTPVFACNRMSPQQVQPSECGCNSGSNRPRLQQGSSIRGALLSAAMPPPPPPPPSLGAFPSTPTVASATHHTGGAAIVNKETPKKAKGKGGKVVVRRPAEPRGASKVSALY